MCVGWKSKTRKRDDDDWNYFLFSENKNIAPTDTVETVLCEGKLPRQHPHFYLKRLIPIDSTQSVHQSINQSPQSITSINQSKLFANAEHGEQQKLAIGQAFNGR